MIEYTINLCGVSCAVVEWNPQAETKVFALHGWLDNLASFESIAAHAPNLHIIAIDFPGHGHSAHIPTGQLYHFIDGIYLINDLARHFKLKKINLLGHSMGGATAYLYAAAAPEKVNKLIAIESLGPLTAEPDKGVALLQAAIKQRNDLHEKSKPIYPDFNQALNARAIASKIQSKLIKPIVERGLAKVDNGYTWRADARLRITSATRLSEAQLLTVLSEIQCEVLLVEAKHGFLQPESLFLKRRAALANLKTHLLEGGHHVHLEHPLEVACLIQAFLLENA
ncbi:alpha/beta fold hydrolase [Aliikangiella sp. IMCC44653]